MDHNNMAAIKGQDVHEEVDLPPGFRFHPTDEELITHYLCRKIMDGSFTAVAIGEADLNKCEPWDLPSKAKMGENEWYFFYLRDKKYPNGLRTNRATEAGYWKATGKDKEIFKGKSLIGMKKTLVFYKGRAPKGEKSNWVMHEYRFEGQHNLPQSAKTEWVISRVFEKSCNGKKVYVPGGVRRMCSIETLVAQSQLPPSMDFSQSDVSCFSNQTSFPRAQTDLICSYNNDHIFGILGNRPNPISRFGQASSNSNPADIHGNDQFLGPNDFPTMGNYLDSNCCSSMQFKRDTEMVNVSQETGLPADMNRDGMSTVVPNMEMGRREFDSGFGYMELKCLWPC